MGPTSHARDIAKDARASSRTWAIVCLGMAVGVFVLVTLIFPDGKATGPDVWRGLALAALFAAAPVTALIKPEGGPALGGAMVIAGAAATPGGNLLGPLMVVSGIVLLVGSGRPFSPTGRLIAWSLGGACLLFAGWWLVVSVGN